MTSHPNQNSVRSKESDVCCSLTHLPERIHCATADGASHSDAEIDRIDTNGFINALAEVALAVARRKEESDS